MTKMRGLLVLFPLLACGRQAARVDLATAKKTPEPQEVTTGYSRGGGVFDHLGPVQPDTPTLSVRLNRITMGSGCCGNTVEVVVTNTGPAAVAIPIGADPVPLLAPSRHDRRYLAFSITSGDGAHRAGSATSASNSEHPETSALLEPGDTAVFILPLYPGPRAIEAARAGMSPRFSVSVWLHRQVIDNGKDWSEPVGHEIRSENTLPLP